MTSGSSASPRNAALDVEPIHAFRAHRWGSAPTGGSGPGPLHAHPLAPGALQTRRSHGRFWAQPSEEEMGVGS